MLNKPRLRSIALYLFAFILSLICFTSPILATYDPLSVANNKVGVHILFSEEINLASRLVNNNTNNSWGYAVIPIQASDRNRDRWQKFFDNCRDLKVIPIIRVATVPQSSNWAKPDNHDLIDFANFLNELNWPTRNRYVIIFNEVNRADEFGGFVSPETYADILINAVSIFKERSDKFFILPAALDNAASNNHVQLKYDTYLTRMHLYRPGIFSLIDGWNSHAYPNPDFSSPPQKSGYNKIDSYNYDIQLLRKLGYQKNYPIFITETGWKNDHLPDSVIAQYYQFAFSNVWNDSRIVMVAPFLLKAGAPPFSSFSLVNSDGSHSEQFTTLQSFAITGNPNLDFDVYTNNQTGEKISNSLPPESPKTSQPAIVKKLLDLFIKLINKS